MPCRARLAGAMLAALCTGGALAASVESADFRYEDRRYRYRYVARLEAPLAAVHRVMTDYERLARVNDDIIVSRVIKAYDDGRVKRQMLLKHCVFVFCFDLNLVEYLESRDDGTIVASIVPGEGNFSRGSTEMRFESLPDGGTRITTVAEQQPAFFIPPLVGPLLMKRSYLREVAETARRIEALVREEPRP